MKTRRRMEITVEQRTLVLRRTVHRVPLETVWCLQCPAQTLLVTPEEAARLASVSPRTIYRWVESEQVHYLETSEGELLVCLNSLPTTISSKEKNHA